MGFNGILAWPVFPWWLRYNDATHEALFSSSGYQKQWPHQEISPVQGVVPIFQRFTSNVLADSNKMALAGHDFGPLAPHLCTPPDNTLIALTMTLSSCKWPAIAHRRKHKGKNLCVFLPLVAPYLHCHDNSKESDEKPADGGRPNKRAKAKAWAGDFAKDVKGSLPGAGHLMIPTGGLTTFLRLNPLDLVAAAGMVLLDATVTVLWNRTAGKGFTPKRHFEPFQSMTHIPQQMVREAAMRYVRDKVVAKAAKDLVTGLVRKQQINVPFKLVSLDLKTGKLKTWTRDEDTEWKAENLLVERPRSASNGPPPLVVKPLELRPETDDSRPQPAQAEPDENDGAATSDPASAEPEDSGQDENLGPYDPQRALMDDLLAGVPHAF